MDIIGGKYKLVPTQNGVAVIEKETGKLAFFINEGHDFSAYKRGNIYVIGCLTITEEEFNTAIGQLETFQRNELVAFKQEAVEHYKTNPGYLKMIENANTPT
jgi:hypothetical protein